MSPQQALETLDKVAANTNTNRAGHDILKKAVATLAGALAELDTLKNPPEGQN